MKITTSYGDITLNGGTLTSALQYGPTQGHPPLKAWLRHLQKRLHPSPFYQSHPDHMELLITPGSQDGLSKIFDMVLSVGDPLLIEEPSYPGTLAGLRPYKPNFLRVACDSHGMNPDKLRETIENTNEKPKLLYVQPNCSNPLGVSLTLERRTEILKIASEHDLLVVEDDPYYFLKFDHKPLPSLLSLDTEGRVLRLDSFSKVLSSGIRLGYVTGHKILINQLALHLQVSSMHCSSLSQVLVYELLEELLGEDKFLKHTHSVADFYAQQCKSMVAAAEKHLKGLCTWNIPDGGMFLWLKVNDIADTREMIERRALEQQILVAPGNLFFIDTDNPTPYLRASFSNVNAQQMDEGCKRLAKLIRNEIKRN